MEVMVSRGEELDNFGSMPQLQRMVSEQERVVDDLRAFPPNSPQCVRLVELAPKELLQETKVGPISRAHEHVTVPRRVFICQRKSGARKSTGAGNASQLDHSFGVSTVSTDLRSKSGPLSSNIHTGKTEAIQAARGHTVLVMSLDLSGVRDAAFQQMQLHASRNGLTKLNLKAVEFRQLGEFATVTQFRKWFTKENGETNAWHLISRQCFALRPVEVHIYMCNLCEDCPCLLAVRYSMLFDEIRVFHSREHVHKKQQEDDDDDIQVIWPPLGERNQPQNPTTSEGCISPSVSQHSTSSPPTKELSCEVANTGNDCADNTVHSPASIDCEPSNTSSNSSHAGPAEDLLSKVLQEADIPVDFGLGSENSSKNANDLQESRTFEDDQGVVAREEVVSSSNILVRRSIVMRDNKMRRIPLLGQRVHETNALRSRFTIAGGAFSRCFENARSTSFPAVASESIGRGRKRRIWRVVSNRSTDSPSTRGTIKVRRVESIKAIYQTPYAMMRHNAEEGVATIASSGICASSPPVYTLTAEQLEALRPKRNGESDQLKAIGEDEQVAEQQPIMADELMDCCFDSEEVTFRSSMEQTAPHTSMESNEQQQTPDWSSGSDQQSVKAEDGKDPIQQPSAILSSLFKSDQSDIEVIVEELLRYMKCCLTTRGQMLCCQRILEIVDAALTNNTMGNGGSDLERRDTKSEGIS